MRWRLCVLLFLLLPGGATAEEPEIRRYGAPPEVRPLAPTGPMRWAQQMICCGEDDRRPVDMSTWPHRAIAYVEILDDFGFHLSNCTGAVIGTGLVLTAAHCVYDPDGSQWGGGWAPALRIAPAKNGSLEPYSYQFAVDALVPNGWSTGSSAYDWGLILLPDARMTSATGEIPLGVFTTATLSSPTFGISLVGYAGERSTWGVVPYGASRPSFVQVTDTRLYYDIDTSGGQSGAPVWQTSAPRVLGVHTLGGALANSATRMTSAMVQSMDSACRTVGCSFSAYMEPVPTATPTARPTVTPTPRATSTPVVTALRRVFLPLSSRLGGA